MVLPDYPTVSTVVMKTEPYKHYIEIFPAALLSQRWTWEKMTYGLPARACLLITNPKDKAQTKFMDKLTQLFRQKGRSVIVWKVEPQSIA